jgi:hypothetical protein
VTTLTYQRNDSPLGGKDRMAVGLNDTAITTTVGSVMNARSRTTASRSIKGLDRRRR